MRTTRRPPAATTLRSAFIAASAAWAVLLIAVPFLASRPHASALGSALIAGVYVIGSAVCHQLPERSYHLWAAQMPVCARCAGIYFGAVVGAVGAGLFRRGRSPAFQYPRAWLTIAAAPTVVTLVYEWTTGVMPSHAIRFAAGLAIGLVVAWLVVRATDNQVN